MNNYQKCSCTIPSEQGVIFKSFLVNFFNATLKAQTDERKSSKPDERTRRAVASERRAKSRAPAHIRRKDHLFAQCANRGRVPSSATRWLPPCHPFRELHRE